MIEPVNCWDCEQAGKVTPAAEDDPDDLCSDCRAVRDAEDARDLDRVVGYYRRLGWLPRGE